ncbi:integrase core domain-containing protein [Actinomadura luteofluorescens]|uniref:integrase core domain-containing protein n=1 Tax=Actinomadura luteofluorescens TaxID=46163 RepID=UPI0037B8540E
MLLNHVVPFESLAAAQDAIDAWVHAYNHQRPHQALNMATPASVFRPHAPARLDEPEPEPEPESQDEAAAPLRVEVIEPPADRPQESAVQFEVRVHPAAR